jgi:lipoteichoic acid synthase
MARTDLLHYDSISLRTGRRRSPLSMWDYLRKEMPGWALIATSAGIILYKSLALCGYLVTWPYVTSNVRAAIFFPVESVSIYVCWALIAIAPALAFRDRARSRYLILCNAAVSTLFLFDLWYYRAFTRFISFHNLREAGNLSHLAQAVLSLIRPTDFLFLADVVALALFLTLRKSHFHATRNIPAFLLLSGLPAAYLHYYNANYIIDEVQLFALRWRPIETIGRMSPLGYHVYDAYLYWTDAKPSVTDAERREIWQWFEEKKENLPPNKAKGLFSGRNLILLQCESLENFVIGKEIGGQVITPNLNRMISNSLYFTNYLEQVADGTSMDAEYIANTSMYPALQGSVSFRYPRNTFPSFPRLLQKRGYLTADIHSEPASFWNWGELMADIGMERLVDETAFQKDEVIDLGLSDGSFLRQAQPILAHLRPPFYAYLVTMSNHCPYDLPRELRELKLDPDLDQTEVGGYLQSVHYLDKQIGLFLSGLDSSGLLENTVIGLFGDHCGVHRFSGDAVAQRPAAEQKWMENGYRIPLLIYQKHLKGEIIDRIGAQIDLLPTLCSLMGLEDNEFEDMAMGRNLLNTKKSFAVLCDGSYVGPPTTEKEKAHALRGFELGARMLEGDYFAGIRHGESR